MDYNLVKELLAYIVNSGYEQARALAPLDASRILPTHTPSPHSKTHSLSHTHLTPPLSSNNTLPTRQGAILVFLPGWDDITRLRDLMKRDAVLGREDKFWVLPLHSGGLYGVQCAHAVCD